MPSGGNSAPTSTTVNQSNLPEYARPYFEGLMGRAEQQSQVGYTPYNAQRIADINANQTAGYNSVANIASQGAPGIDAANQSIAGSSQTAAGLQGFQASPITSTYQNQSYTPANIQSNYQNQSYNPTQITSDNFNNQSASDYMNPYMQQVVKQQQDNAVRQFTEGQGARDQGAIGAGAYGGSRNAIARGVAERGLQRQLGDIQAQGSQNAFTQAQAQFNADQARKMQAQQGTEASRQYGAGLGIQSAQFGAGQNMTAQQQNEASRQYGAGLGAQSAQFAAGQNMTAQQQSEAARQAAAGIQNTGANLGLAQAQLYGNTANLGQTMGLQRAAAQQGVGDVQRATQQQELDQKYTDFMNQLNWNPNQLQALSGILRGVPVNPNTTTQQYTTTNPLSQMAGLGLSGLGLYNSMNKAA